MIVDWRPSPSTSRLEKRANEGFVEDWGSTNPPAGRLALGRGVRRQTKPTRQIGLALAPGIKAGELETAVFPVWDPVCKRVVRVTAYRQKPAKVAKAVKKG